MQFLNMEVTAEPNILHYVENSFKDKITKIHLYYFCNSFSALKYKKVLSLAFIFETNILIPQYPILQGCKLWAHVAATAIFTPFSQIC